MRVAFKVCGVLLAIASPSIAHAELIFGLQGSDRIVVFDSATPTSISSNQAIAGLGAGEVLIGLDVRPANNLLYTLATSGNLYSLSVGPGAYAASLIGNMGTAFTGSNSGFDFNPTTDRLRVVNDTDQNLRLNPDNAVTIVDGSINPSNLNLIAAAYINNFAGATMTTLYAIDSLTASLMRATNPNAGTYVSVGSLGLGAIGTDARVGFDVSGLTGTSFLSLNDQLYTLDLTTGAATSIGAIGASNVRGLTVAPESLQPPVTVPEPATSAMLLAGLAALGVVRRRRALVKS